MSTEADLSTMIAHVEIQIPHPIRAVWELVTDVPRMATLSPEVVSADWLTPDGCVEGAQFLAHNHRGSLDWQVTGEVIVVRPTIEFSWVIGDPSNPSSTWSYRLRPEQGSTRVSEHFQHGPAMSWIRQMVNNTPAASKMIIQQRRQMLKRDMRLTLQRAASMLDAQDPAARHRTRTRAATAPSVRGDSPNHA